MSKKWKKFLLFWCIGLLLIGLAACTVLYKYLEVYEVTRAETVIEKMVSEYSPDDWYEAARNNPKLDVNEFENPLELYNSYIENSKLDDSRISYFEESSKSSDAESVYGIRSGSTTIAEVTLIQDQSNPVGFGRCEWMLKEISTPNILKYLSSEDVFISAPKETEIICNGKAVSDSYRSDDIIEITPANRFESAQKSPDGYSTYSLGKMYGDISLSATSGDNLIASENDGKLVFTLSDEKYAVSISAPDDVTVYINGIEAEKSEGTLDTSLLDNLDKYTNGNEYNCINYTVTDFMKKPEVEARDKTAAELKALSITDGKYVFMHQNDEDAKEEYLEYAEEFFKRYLTYALNSDVEYSALESVLRRCLPGTELYSYLKGAEDALMWKRQSKVESSEILFDNFSKISDKCFVCSVEYTIKQTAEDEIFTDSDETLHNAFQLVFVYESRTWVCAKMVPVS